MFVALNLPPGWTSQPKGPRSAPVLGLTDATSNASRFAGSDCAWTPAGCAVPMTTGAATAASAAAANKIFLPAFNLSVV
jgi:hypothetical protein